MKNTKKAALLLMLCALVLTLSSCYDFLDIRYQMIVYGLAVDKQEDTYHLSAEVIKTAGESPEEGKANSIIYTASGDSIYSAMNNLYQSADKMFYWGHLEVVVVSRSVVDQNFAGVIDILTREPQIYLNTRLLVCTGDPAELLRADVQQGQIATKTLKDILQTSRLRGERLTNHIWQANRQMDYGSYTLNLPLAELDEESKTPKITGTVIIKDGRIFQIFGQQDMQTYLFLQNRLKGGYLATFPVVPGVETSLEIIKNDCSMSYKIENGQGIAKYRIVLFVSIFEISRELDFKNPDTRTQLQNATAQHIEARLREFTDQNPADIYGYSQKIAQNHPELSQTGAENVAKVADNTKVEFEINVILSESRMMI